MKRSVSLACVMLSLMATPALAQQAPACAVWEKTSPVLASPDAAKAPDIKAGESYVVSLSPIASVVYPVTPKQPVAAGRYGGLLALTIADGGSYNLAIDGPAQIDIVKDGSIVQSLANTDKDVCGKGTAFRLDAGLYSLQIANAAGADIKLILSRK